MADLIKRNQTLFAAAETTEGTAGTIDADAAILASDVSIEEDLTMNSREYQGAPGIRPPVPGSQNGASVSFSTELKGNGTTTLPEVDVLLSGCFGPAVAANLDTTVSGVGSTSTVVNITAATNASPGSLVMVEKSTADTYEVRLITAADTTPTPDTMTVTPALVLGAYATNAKKVKEMRTWAPGLPPSAVNSVSFDMFYNSDSGAAQRERVLGARGTFKMDSPRAGAIPMFSWAFKGWSVTRVTTGTRPTPSYDTATPKAGVATFMSVDGAAVDAFDISFDLGAEVATKMSQNSTTGVYGTPTVAFKPSGSFKIHPAHNSIAEYTAWEAGTARSWLFQVGHALYGTWAIFVPKAVAMKVGRVDDGGVGALQIDWVATEQDDALATAADSSVFFGAG